MMDWFPAVMTLVGVLVGLGVQELRIWRERKDKYKDMIFEKRLDAHQGAYYRCMKLAESMRPDKLVRDGGVEEAIKETWRGLDWLHQNALYLDDSSGSEMNGFIAYVAGMAIKYRGKEWRSPLEVRKEVNEVAVRLAGVLGSIRRGVGVKYLPEGDMPIVGVAGTESVGMYDEFLREMVRNTEESRKEEKG
jgi:hypothetical protein